MAAPVTAAPVTAAAVTAAEFSRLMIPLGPFEPAPTVAVAVSGGADSLALTLLAADWARAHGGRAVALTVDHGLRPASRAEAGRVGGWLAALGIEHHVLVWDGPKPAADVQAAARAARYRLIAEWCRRHSVLHVLLAHHRDDQAETLLLRLGRGSGVDGLASMAPVQELPFLRLLRPLLGIDPARLGATLRKAGQDWVDDPSNRNPAFSRVRLRALMPALAAEGMTSERLAATARRMARARAALEQAVAEAAARTVTFDPGGWAVVQSGAFASVADEVGLRLLSRLLGACGGGDYPPRAERVEGLYRALRGGLERGRTLGGCRVVPWGEGVLFCREPAKMAGPVELAAGCDYLWDGRFRVRVPTGAPAGLRLGPLGSQGWSQIVSAVRPARLPPVPAPVRPTLPAIYSEDAISAVPHVGYNREEWLACASRWIVALPPNPLTVAGRCLV